MTRGVCGVVLSSVFLICSTALSHAEDLLGAEQLGSKSGSRPGKTDPVNPGYRSIFRDDELLLMIGRPDINQMSYQSFSPATSDLKQWNLDSKTSRTFQPSEFSGLPQVPTARGRITSHESDQTVYILQEPGSEAAAGVELWDSVTGERRNHWIKLDDGGQSPYRSYSFVDVAVGDMDLATEEIDGGDCYHDEVAVVLSKGDDKTVLVILDYHAFDGSTNDPLARIEIDRPGDGGNKKFAAVAMGDFNNDGYQDVALAHATDWEEMQLCIYRFAFDTDDDGNHVLKNPLELERVAQYQWAPLSGINGLDVAVGDFAFAGHDQVAVVDTSREELFIFDVVDDQLKQKYAVKRFANSFDKVRLLSGLFMFDGADGWYNTRRRQLMVVGQYANKLWVEMLEITSDWKVNTVSSSSVSPSGTLLDTWDATVGNFKGHTEDNEAQRTIGGRLRRDNRQNIYSLL